MSERHKRPGAWSHEKLEAFRSFVDGFVSHSRNLAHRRGDLWEPRMDVYETQEAVVIKLSLPGVQAGDVRVRFEGDTVTISGRREAARDAGMVAYHLMEIPNGFFERRVSIRKPINPEAAGAEYRDGFLWLRIPKVQVRVHRVHSLRIRL